jgi:hypothetical protein
MMKHVPRNGAIEWDWGGATMDLRFEWQQPIVVARRRQIVISDEDIQSVHEMAGIYYFARNHGATSIPFYIGESTNLNKRLKDHLKTRKIADVLRGIEIPGAPTISQGARTFHFAYFMPKTSQTLAKALAIAQKFMIQEALAEGIPLLNLQLTTIRAHSISFTGSAAARGVFRPQNFAQE